MQSPPHSITLLKLSLGRSASPRHASGILYPFPGRGSSRLYRQRIVACASSLPSAVDLTTSAAVVCLSCFFPVSRWRWASAVLWSVGALSAPYTLIQPLHRIFPGCPEKIFLVRSAVPGGVAAPGWAWVVGCSAPGCPVRLLLTPLYDHITGIFPAF